MVYDKCISDGTYFLKAGRPSVQVISFPLSHQIANHELYGILHYFKAICAEAL